MFLPGEGEREVAEQRSVFAACFRTAARNDPLIPALPDVVDGSVKMGVNYTHSPQ